MAKNQIRNLLLLFIFLIYAPMSLCAQDISPLKEKIKLSLKDKEPG
jgi:hypothetical protein